MSSTDLAVLSHTPGADPRAIMAAACARPFDVSGSSLELDPALPSILGGGLLGPLPGSAGKLALDLPQGKGALVNRVTPEQLLAIVASLIASSPDAQTACVRLRTEVMGWQFQDSKGNKI